MGQAALPAGGQANPMVYAIDGRESLVIVAGGHHSMETPAGDSVIAYALPQMPPPPSPEHPPCRRPRTAHGLEKWRSSQGRPDGTEDRKSATEGKDVSISVDL